MEEAESRASQATKMSSTLESQLAEAQELLQEETRQKLALNSRLRSIESEKENLVEQVEEDEEARKSLEKQIASLSQQVCHPYWLILNGLL